MHFDQRPRSEVPRCNGSQHAMATANRSGPVRRARRSVEVRPQPRRRGTVPQTLEPPEPPPRGPTALSAVAMAHHTCGFASLRWHAAERRIAVQTWKVRRPKRPCQLPALANDGAPNVALPIPTRKRAGRTGSMNRRTPVVEIEEHTSLHRSTTAPAEQSGSSHRWSSRSRYP